MRSAFGLVAAALTISPFVVDSYNPALAQQTTGWTRQCTGAAGTVQERCVIRQQVAVNNRIVMTGSVGLIGTSNIGPAFSVAVPLRTQLKSGVTVSVDEHSESKIEFNFCDPRGCRANWRITDALLEQLKSGKRMNVAWSSINNTKSRLTFSLEGFASGLESLKK